MTDARACWIAAPGRAELRSEELPDPGPGELLVEALFSGISRGTESLVYAGRVPESEYSRMRAPHQRGEFPGPVKYGYANVGRVIAGSPEWLGRQVFALFPHQNRYVLPERDVHPLPVSVPARRAVLAANLETALNAVWDARPVPGDRVSVVGGGVLGCLLTALLSRYPALDVELVDVLPERGAAARGLGASFALPEAARTGRDLVFHTSSHESGLARAFELCGFQARVIELSWYGTQRLQVPLGQAFHSQRLQLIGSQVGHVSPNKPGWTHHQRLALALQLLDDPRLDALLGAPIPFDELPSRLPSVLGPSAPAEVPPGHCVSYGV